jgi:hypothetical protein
MITGKFTLKEILLTKIVDENVVFFLTASEKLSNNIQIWPHFSEHRKYSKFN